VFLGGFFSLLVLIGIVLVVVWIVSSGDSLSTRRPPGGNRGEETPLDILKKRYARGEIDRDQYEQMKRDLTDRD
jgi:putative membrane protein